MAAGASDSFRAIKKYVAAVPTFHEYVERIARASTYKAICGDGTKLEIGKKFPRIVAKAYHHVAVKATESLDPLVQLRSGMILELYKGKGAVAECTSCREVTLCDALGKRTQPACAHLLDTSSQRQRARPHTDQD